ncbi:MAG: holo-ACP synthase [Desulfovibrio sp.]|jgi:holo-[acyl-carrier protein] synthase|nr:holo-ACP synthase [Desulfovibrio sp.]
MIVGIGLDLVETARMRRSLERFGCRFAAKILHESEMGDFYPLGEDKGAVTDAAVRHAASRFASKEAGAKALGTGFSAGVTPRDIRVYSTGMGKPILTLYGGALEQALAMGASKIHLSLTHTGTCAAAVVILEAGTGEDLTH